MTTLIGICLLCLFAAGFLLLREVRHAHRRLDNLELNRSIARHPAGKHRRPA